MSKNYSMANKGRGFEQEVKIANKQYEVKGIALIQKISTPWQVVRKGKKIISAFPEGKSTLDFRGTVKPRIPISFDCKETTNKKGLPLANIPNHQIDYIRHIDEYGDLQPHDIEDWDNMVATLGKDWATTKAEIKSLIDDDVFWQRLEPAAKQLDVFSLQEFNKYMDDKNGKTP